ncbi:hypothetical protein CALVIDRAFT_598364 [Calocera viscosa TUFC12733]|uniref:N-acetyltransferase domain-containing protein n=1 Tax=Calocera viscosa (strain TUFC12733) TaxID=1330018 RepID=A0A167M7M0_CALVF|nr:hypothetical protein CALVIDRAFT_598364 [Calocera viscosa TUFC12733]
MKSSPRSEDVEPAISEVVYISIWTLRQDRRTLDFVVACAGHKPIFVFSNHSSSGLTAAFLELRIPHLAESMKKVIPDRRVFAIVGIETVAERLAAAWEALTGHRIKQPAYYQATHTFCTRQTLAPLTASDVGMCRMGLATEGHILQAGRLCSAFTQSAHDDPYQLSVQQGIQEAKRLIQRKELYVCDVLRGGRADDYDVVCIIAVTRKSTKVAAVSKVFTHENYRRRGYAKRLLAHVCHEVLRTKQQIVLFVAHDLKTAAGVYGRVGFVGVGDRPMSERALVERWLELGFEDTDTGHW